MKQISDYSHQELVDLLTKAAIDILSMESEIGRLRTDLEREQKDVRRVQGFKLSSLDIQLQQERAG